MAILPYTHKNMAHKVYDYGLDLMTPFPSDYCRFMYAVAKAIGAQCGALEFVSFHFLNSVT